MKQNFRQKFTWLWAVIIALVSISAYAQFADGSLDGYAGDKLLNEARILLDKIELDSPRSHADLVKLREKIEAIYSSGQTQQADVEPQFLVRKKSARRRSDWGSFYESLKGLRDAGLKEALNKGIKNNRSLDYTDSRRYVMLEIDNYDSYVECIYTGKVIPAKEMPKTTTMNIEHSWPQSKGATGIAKADLHHLFPTDPVANSTRSSLPFGIVDNPKWAQGGSKCDLRKFEVRKKYCGNIARALFYFSVRYGKLISRDEEEVLRRWNKEDPVDANEKARNDRVESVQGNRNPFIDHPELIEYIADF